MYGRAISINDISTLILAAMIGLTFSNTLYAKSVPGLEKPVPIRNCSTTDFTDPLFPPIDWEAFLDRQDLVWEAMGDDWGNSAFLGNGLMGACIYKTQNEPRTLGWELGRTDVAAEYYLDEVDWSIPRVPIGKVGLSTHQPVQKADMRLHLYHAEATGTVQTAEGLIRWRSFLERESNVLVIETRTEGHAELDIHMRPEWGISPRIVHTGTDPNTIPADQLPPKPYWDKVDGLDIVVQPLTVKGAHATALFTERVSEEHRIFYLSVGKSYQRNLPRRQDVRAAVQEAVSSVKTAQAEGLETLTKRHRQWWHDYLSQAYVALPDDPRSEQFYWLQIYKFGGASRADLPILIDNMGPYFTQCGWPGTWWNLNIQLSYFPTFGGNRMDVGRSMITAIDHFFDSGSLQTPEDPNAITHARVSTYYAQGGETFELGNLTWVLHNYWRYWKYSMDEQVARNLFPILKANIQYYFNVMDVDPNGMIHLPPMVSPEYNFRSASTGKLGPLKDTNYSHQLFRWGLNTLLDLDRRFGLEDPDRIKWKDALQRVSPLPIGPYGLKISAEEDYNFSHRHYSHLLAIYPLHTIHPDQGPEARTLIQTSVDHWQSKPQALQGYSLTGASAMYATLGDAEKAYEKLQQFYRANTLQPNSMYMEGGGPVIETPLSAVESINYMMLQSWADVIRIFPATPQAWNDVVFANLRTEGAFLVSAERKQGKTQWISIKSLAGMPCVIQTDMDAFSVHSSRPVSVEPITGPSNQKRWRIDLKKEEAVLLTAKPGSSQKMPAVKLNKI
jgi:hypothetical protein